MLVKEVLYDLDDVTIIPAVQSDIRHRGDINSYYHIDGKKYLPIFVSPMECIINKDNFDIYEKNQVIPILPRTETLDDRLKYSFNARWAAFGLQEFVDNFCDEYKAKTFNKGIVRVLIDNANGHMSELPKSIKIAKALSNKYGYVIEIMAGNIAHPEGYKELSEAGADYVRCAIGTGNCCVTWSNTSTGMPMASLIDRCKQLKEQYNLTANIIADGGINSYNRAIKALALGADFVMIGSLFGHCFESASEFTKADLNDRDVIEGFGLNDLNKMRFDENIDDKTKKSYIGIYKPMKAVWGMSTRRAQLSIGLAQGKKKEDIKLKTSEGVEKQVPVEFTLHQWLENFGDYLRSSMSYCNCKFLGSFIGGPNIMLMSESAKRVINK